MPTVRRSRVEQTALPGVRVGTTTPDAAFGVASRVDLSAPIKLVQSIVDEQRQKVDQIQLQDMDNGLEAAYGEAEREAQAFKGVDALKARDKVRETWEKRVSEVEAGMQGASDQVRQAFRARANQRWTRLYGAVEQYAAKEMEKHDATSTESALTNRVNRSIADPTLAPTLAAENRALVADYGRRQGWSPEKLAEEQGKWVSRVHVGALDRMLTAGDDRTAKAYYEAHKADFAGADIAKIEKALAVGSTLGESQRLSDQIITKPGVTRASAFEEARTIADPEVRKATEDRLDVEFARRDRAERDQYEGLQAKAYGYVEQGRRPPATLWAGLKPADRRAFSAMLEHEAKGTQPETDLETLYTLMTRASDPAQRAAFANENLLKYRDKLSKPDFEQMVRAQIAARAGKEPDGARGFMTTTAIVEEGLAPLKLKDNSPRKIAFRKQIDDDIAAARQANGDKPLTPDQERHIVAQRVVKLYIDTRGAIDKKKPIAELTADERGRAYFNGDLPSADESEIRALMRRNGVRDSEQMVRRAYAAVLMKDRAMFDRVTGATK